MRAMETNKSQALRRNSANTMKQLLVPGKLFTSLVISLIFTVCLSEASKHSSSLDGKSNTVKDHSNVMADAPNIIGGDGSVDATLPRNYVRAFKQQNPNVISIGAVLESQEAIAHFLQVSDPSKVQMHLPRQTRIKSLLLHPRLSIA